MTRKKLETIEEIIRHAHARTVGGEPTFAFPDVLTAIAACTKHEIAVLGVELFKATREGYLTEGISDYDLRVRRAPWHEFVSSNNRLADQFVRANPCGDDHFYLLTASSEEEFDHLTRQAGRD